MTIMTDPQQFTPADLARVAKKPEPRKVDDRSVQRDKLHKRLTRLIATGAKDSVIAKVSRQLYDK